jgi:hypothetical protein
MHPQLYLSWNDLLGALQCIILSWAILSFVKKHYHNDALRKDFRLGFYFRIAGLLASAVFNLYFIKADSTSFFGATKIVSAALRGSDLSDSLKLFFTDFDSLPFKLKTFFSNNVITNLIYDNNRTLVHLAGIIAFFSFDSYLVISFVFTMWAYLGIWLIYVTAIKMYPTSRIWLFYLIIAYPPLCFWTTGLMKDPLCIGSLGILFYTFFNTSGRKARPWTFLILSIISAFLLIKIKGYLFVGFSISCLLAYFFYYLASTGKYTRWMALSLFSLVIFSIFYFFGEAIEEKMFDTFSEEVVERINTVTEAQLRHGGTSYDLGEMELSGWGLVKYAAAAINVALFRPYFWEYLNPLVLTSSLEGMIMFLMLMYLLFKVRPRGIFSAISSSPILIFSFFFTLATAMMAGGIAFNYGTLARYKIPLIPFYYILMICIPIIRKQIKAEKDKLSA